MDSKFVFIIEVSIDSVIISHVSCLLVATVYNTHPVNKEIGNICYTSLN